MKSGQHFLRHSTHELPAKPLKERKSTMPSTSFDKLGLSRAVTQALASKAITQPFAIQSAVIPDVLAGHDVLVQAPTGSGKTLAFAAPLVDRLESSGPRPGCLVLAPTRELASQIALDAGPLAAARGLSVAAVYGGVGVGRQAHAAARAHLLVATPGRLLDLLGRGVLTLDGIRILVLDEADRMLDMGFRPDVDRIVAQTPNSRQTLFFSATLANDAGKLAASYTRSPRRHEHLPQAAGKAISHRFLGVSQQAKLEAVAGEIRRGSDGRTLVFVRTKRGADRLAKRLSGRGIEVAAMHGNKSQAQRTKTLARFSSGRLTTLVATDVAARGIDVDGITNVINFDPPGDVDAYVHRIGRTGRAGRTGEGLTLVCEDQAGEVAEIARELKLESEFLAGGFDLPARPRRRRRR